MNLDTFLNRIRESNSRIGFRNPSVNEALNSKLRRRYQVKTSLIQLGLQHVSWLAYEIIQCGDFVNTAVKLLVP
jgi:hypothetical protein